MSDTDRDAKIFPTLAVLIIVGVVADLIDIVVYRRFLNDAGIGWFGTVPWSLTWGYLWAPD